jgi:hypothetical protein
LRRLGLLTPSILLSGGGRDGAFGSRHRGRGEMKRINVPLCDGMRPSASLNTSAAQNVPLHTAPNAQISRSQCGLVALQSRTRQAVASGEAPRSIASCRLPHAHPLTPLASFNTCPVYDRFTLAISFGGPSATISPPRSPPSGPRSMTQSALRIMSRLCSITRTVLPLSTKPVEHVQQPLRVGKMQPGRRFIEDVHGAAGGSLGEFAREFHALGFTAGQAWWLTARASHSGAPHHAMSAVSP